MLSMTCHQVAIIIKEVSVWSDGRPWNIPERLIPEARIPSQF
jgi:hypothetical protein